MIADVNFDCTNVVDSTLENENKSDIQIMSLQRTLISSSLIQ